MHKSWIATENYRQHKEPWFHVLMQQPLPIVLWSVLPINRKESFHPHSFRSSPPSATFHAILVCFLVAGERNRSLVHSDSTWFGSAHRNDDGLVSRSTMKLRCYRVDMCIIGCIVMFGKASKLMDLKLEERSWKEDSWSIYRGDSCWGYDLLLLLWLEPLHICARTCLFFWSLSSYSFGRCPILVGCVPCFGKGGGWSDSSCDPVLAFVAREVFSGEWSRSRRPRERRVAFKLGSSSHTRCLFSGPQENKANSSNVELRWECSGCNRLAKYLQDGDEKPNGLLHTRCLFTELQGRTRIEKLTRTGQ